MLVCVGSSACSFLDYRAAKFTGHERCENCAMIAKACVVTGAALGLMSSPTADAFHAGASPASRGARGTATRGGQQQNLEATSSGFDLGEWFKQAFIPPTKANVEKSKGR